jgi:hypothetical protein
MKLNLFKTITLAGALVTSGAAFSASASENLRVTVPFSFVLAGQEFSAGKYRVQQRDNGLIIVQGEGRAAAVLGRPTDDPKHPSTALVFSSGDSHEYLVGVQVEGAPSLSIPQTAYQQRKLTVATR